MNQIIKELDELIAMIPAGLLISHGWNPTEFNKKYNQLKKKLEMRCKKFYIKKGKMVQPLWEYLELFY